MKMTVKMAEDLPATQLLHIIEENLSSGLDEILKTPDFHLQMTSVFNQLADGGSNMVWAITISYMFTLLLYSTELYYCVYIFLSYCNFQKHL